MRGFQRLRSAQTMSAGHALIQNLRRGHHEIATGERLHDQLQIAFVELALCV
jgi:transposase, IS6 family